MMQTPQAYKYVLSICAAAGMLAACSSGSQSAVTPSAGTNAIHTLGARIYHGVIIAAFRPGAPQARAYKNAVVPAARLKPREKLAYVGNFYGGGGLEAFHFPKGEPLGRTIKNATGAQGMCTRTARGTFWVVASASDEVEEFKAGRTTGPFKTLTVSAGEPAGCSIDRNSGDLAVSILTAGDVVVFAGGSGSGTEIADGLVETYFLGYDSSGNLFADGFNSSFAVAVVEKPKGSSTFHPIGLPNTIEFPGGVQWDGTYITIGDQEADAIYRYSISGSTATLEGTVTFSDGSDCASGDIYKRYYLCPDAGDDNVKVYAYPAGGPPLYTWTESLNLPTGAIVVEK